MAEPEEVVAPEAQERQVARILSGAHDGYLPNTVSIYGPPGTGKTLTTRRLAREFASRHEEVAVEYVSLKECRSLFSAVAKVHEGSTGEARGHEGLEWVLAGI